ncbi:hypothetical protein D3C83_228920 [compost metagenome]
MDGRVDDASVVEAGVNVIDEGVAFPRLRPVVLGLRGDVRRRTAEIGLDAVLEL